MGDGAMILWNELLQARWLYKPDADGLKLTIGNARQTGHHCRPRSSLEAAGTFKKTDGQ
jgi:hypothetical protein